MRYCRPDLVVTTPGCALPFLARKAAAGSGPRGGAGLLVAGGERQDGEQDGAARKRAHAGGLERFASDLNPCRPVSDGPGRVSLVAQGVHDFLGVLGVAGFYQDVELGALGRHVQGQAIVRDLNDVGAQVAYDLRNRAQETRPVVTDDAQRYPAAGRGPARASAPRPAAAGRCCRR